MSQINPKNGLVACYPFTANAKDELGNCNNGTINGATLSADRFGKANSAYDFNGSNFIALPTDKFALTEFNYAVWIYIASNPAFGICTGFYQLVKIAETKILILETLILRVEILSGTVLKNYFFSIIIFIFATVEGEVFELHPV